MLDAAFKLIERKGGSRTTLVEIGDLSGYSHGLVSHRFGSKGALVRAVTDRLQHDFAKLLEPALAGRHGLKALTVTAETYLRTAAASDRNAMYVLIGEALGPLREIRGEMAEADHKFRMSVQKLIEGGMQTGEIRARCRSRRVLCAVCRNAARIGGATSDEAARLRYRPSLSRADSKYRAKLEAGRCSMTFACWKSPRRRRCSRGGFSPISVQTSSWLSRRRDRRGRRLAPFLDDIPGIERSLTWHALNYNKRGITLDLSSPDGKALMRDLATKFDVVIEAAGEGGTIDAGYDRTFTAH